VTGFISKQCRSDSLKLNSFVAPGSHERESSPCPSGVGPPASSGELAVDSARPRDRASPDSEPFPLNVFSSDDDDARCSCVRDGALLIEKWKFYEEFDDIKYHQIC